MSAEAEIKQFIDRVLRLKEEQDTLGEDIREVYAEAKGRGYDKTAMGAVVALVRKREKIGSDAFDEKDAMVAIYLSAYEGPARVLVEALASHTPAPARTRENIEEFPVDAKLVATVANAVQTETGRKALIAAVDIMIEREEQIDPDTGEITNPEAKASEDNGTHEAQDGPGVTGDASRLSVGGGTHAADTSEGAIANVSVGVTAGETATNSENTPDPRPLTDADGHPRIPSSSPGCVKSDRSPPVVGQGCESGGIYTGSKEEQAVTQFEPTAFIRKASILRPDCLNPDQCGGHGSHQCYACTKAAREVAA